MKYLTFGLSLTLLLFTFFYLGTPEKGHGSTTKHTYETDDTKFYNGEILLPDYIHPLDTLIVVNSDSLNWCMENYDIASDGDISDVLNAFTKHK